MKLTMKIEKDKFNALTEKDQNLQLLKVSTGLRFYLLPMKCWQPVSDTFQYGTSGSR